MRHSIQQSFTSYCKLLFYIYIKGFYGYSLKIWPTGTYKANFPFFNFYWYFNGNIDEEKPTV